MSLHRFTHSISYPNLLALLHSHIRQRVSPNSRSHSCGGQSRSTRRMLSPTSSRARACRSKSVSGHIASSSLPGRRTSSGGDDKRAKSRKSARWLRSGGRSAKMRLRLGWIARFLGLLQLLKRRLPRRRASTQQPLLRPQHPRARTSRWRCKLMPSRKYLRRTMPKSLKLDALTLYRSPCYTFDDERLFILRVVSVYCPTTCFAVSSVSTFLLRCVTIITPTCGMISLC